ncbi:MAG: PIN domain-containing protein [Proteobacteria bacterium]|nr:PIN domain-containing protein [Pseudomonadota bacterium]
MSGADFLDSNVFIYAVDPADPAKQTIARELIGQALATQSGVISHQVVQETLNVLGHKFKVSASRSDRDDLLRNVLAPLWHVFPSVELYASAMQIHEKQGFGFYDSLIVAAAVEAKCKRLLTEDLQHGQRIGTLRIENPFRS